MTGLSHAKCILIALLLPAASALAAPSLEVRDIWVQATVPGQPVAGAFMTLRSAVASRLVAVTSNVSKTAEVHSMSHDNGVMRMRRVDSLELPAGQPVMLAPGALHLMLAGLQQPLRAGEMVQLEFTTVDAAGMKSTTRVEAPVRRESPR